MHDLTVEEILVIHAGIMARDGGDARVLSEGNLHQLVFQANLVQDPLPRAAATLYSLCAYKVFRDGNKRTARALAEMILSEGGHTFPGNDSHCFALMQGIMDFTVEIEEIEEYLLNKAGTG